MSETTHAKSSSTRNSRWSRLPGDLLNEILTRLTDLPDFARFSRVCTSWRSAEIDRRRRSKPPPLLAARSRDDPNSWSLFYLSEAATKYRRLPNMSVKLGETEFRRGCSMGWFLISKVQDSVTSLHLLNPISGEQVRLPSKGGCAYDALWLNFEHAVLSSAPTSDGCDIAVATNSGSLSLCRLGKDDEWSTIRFDGWCLSMSFHEGLLYCLGPGGTTKVFDLGLRMVRCIALPAGDASRDLGLMYHGLVELDGQLLRVFKYYARGGRVVFAVFKLVVDGWVRVESLGDGVLFLGRWMAESISAERLNATGFGARANCIYHSEGSRGILEFSMEDGSSRLIPATEGIGADLVQWILFVPQVW